MTATLVEIANPLRFAERIVSEIPAGQTVADVAEGLGWPSYTARVNDGGAASPGLVIPEGAVVTIFRRPTGFDIGAIALNLLISAAITVGFSLLFPPPRPVRSRDDESSPTYTFNGVQSNRVAGLPIAWQPGRIKSGGQIVNEYTAVDGLPPTTTYHALISFGHGPYFDIGGIEEDTPGGEPLTGARIPVEIQINGNPARNYQGVKVWIRRGTNEQEPIPGFDEVRQNTPSGSTLLSEEVASTNTNQLITGFSVAGDDEFLTNNDPAWVTGSPVVFDFDVEDVDGFVVRLSFPQGFFRQNTSNGATEPAFFGFQIRYRQLDNLGVPITTGGFAGDGYVRLPVEGPFSVQQRTPFEYEFRHLFIDPSSFTPPQVGEALRVSGAGGASLTYPVGGSQGFDTGVEIAELSGMAWVNLADFGPSDNATIMQSILGNQGWRLSITRSLVNAQGSFSTSRLRFTIGRGSRLLDVRASSTTGTSNGIFNNLGGEWVHVAFTYRRNSVPRLYVNGNLIGIIASEGSGNFDLEWVQTPLIVGGGQFTDGSLIDGVKLYSVELSQAQIRSDYNNGDGTRESVDLDPTTLIFNASFDSGEALTELSGADWWGNAPSADSGSTVGVETGVVRSRQIGDLQPGKYRVEILRTTVASSASSVQSAITVDSFSSITSLSLTYPGIALLGISVDATEQLNGGIPQITSINRGVPGRVWDGQSTTAPSIRTVYTENPAWVALGLVLDTELGLGRFYSALTVDLPSFLDWASYCDDVVYNGERRITVANGAGALTFVDVEFDVLVADETGEVRGGLQFDIPRAQSSILPQGIQVGRFLRLTGWPDATTTGVNIDIDNPDGEGYEIYEVTTGSTISRVKCFYDRLDEGAPWDTLGGTRLVRDVLPDTDAIDGAVIEGGERRFSVHARFDSPGRAWDALLSVCEVGRAMPVPTAGRLRIRYAHPQSPVGVISPRNIKPGTFQLDYSSPLTRPNVLSLSILDEFQDYEATPVVETAPEVDVAANQVEVRTSNLELFGVTSPGQAKRHGRYILNINRLQRRTGKFSGSLDTLPFEVGDVLRVSSESAPRGTGTSVLGSAAVLDPSILTSPGDLTDPAWATVATVITTVANGSPFGDIDSNTLTGDGSTQQELSPRALIAGFYTVGLAVKSDAGPTFALRLTTSQDPPNSNVAVVVNPNTGEITNTTSAPGIETTAASQPLWDGWHFVRATFYCSTETNRREIETAVLALIAVDGSSQGIQVAGLTVTFSENVASPPPGRAVILDTDFEFDGSPTMLHLQNQRGDVFSANLDSRMPARTYVRGDLVFVDADFPTPPRRGNAVILSTAADELLVELSNVRRVAELSADFEFVEYRNEFFNDEATETGTQGEDTGDEHPVTASLAGDPPTVDVKTYVVETVGGVSPTRAVVAWSYDESDLAALRSTRVYFRVLEAGPNPSGGGWTLAGEVQKAEGSELEITLPQGINGQEAEFSVVALSDPTIGRSPETGTRVSATVIPYQWKPGGVATLRSGVNGFSHRLFAQLTDADTADALKATRRVEFRRGGWVLGQVIGQTAEGEELVDVGQDLWVDLADTVSAGIGTIYARAISRSGAMSDVITIVPDHSPPVRGEAPDLNGNGGRRWEENTGPGGWVPAAPVAGDPYLSNLRINASDELEFTDGSTEGFFYASQIVDGDKSTSGSRGPSPIFLSAAVEAVQVHPTAPVDRPDANSIEGQRWSDEGPLVVFAGEDGQCTLDIEFRLNRSGAFADFGPWEVFRPGVYECVDVEFRLRVTRPTTEFQVRILRFHTYAAFPANVALKRSAIESAQSEIL